MSTLFIRHPARADHDGSLARFALVADGGAITQQGEGALKSMGDLIAANGNVVLLLAAADVTLLHIKIPPMSAARLKTALPNLVEEQVLGDPADCVLVAAGAEAPDGTRTVAVAQRSWLEALVRTLLTLGARKVAALPGQLCLPLAPGGVSGAIDDTGITVRHGQYLGLGLAMTGEPELALQTVRALAGDAPLTLYVAPEQIGEYRVLTAEAGPGIMLEEQNWAHWIAGSRSAHLDLVPGLGSAGAKARDWTRWRWPIGLTLFAVAVNLVGLNVEWLRMKGEADQIRQSMVQTFRAAYPKETVILDPEAQMRKNIATAKATRGQLNPDEFTYLAAAFGEATRSLGRPPAVTTMAYNARTLTIKVKPDSVDQGAVSQLQAALSQRRLDFAETAPGTWVVRSLGVKP